MTVLLVSMAAISGILLVLIGAVRPQRSKNSLFELRRQAADGSGAAKVALHREALLPGVDGLLRATSSLLLVVTVLCMLGAYGWIVGVVVGIAAAFAYQPLGRLPFMRLPAQKLYHRTEPTLLHYIEKWPLLGAFGGSPHIVRDQRLESREQLLHLLEQSGNVLSDDEKLLLRHGLQFHDQLVENVMTPIDRVVRVNASELLGPLVLDDLHKSGHRYFPVISKKKEGIAGILELDDLLTIDARHSSPTAEKAMDPRVFYIRETDTLRHALGAFLHHHQHMLIVVDESGQPIGLLTMGDVIKILFGTKLTKA